MDYGEGPLLDQTMGLGHLESIYHVNPTSPPYTVSNYPPVYPLALSPLGRVWGPAFWYGRLLSWLRPARTPSPAIRRPPRSQALPRSPFRPGRSRRPSRR